VSDCVLRNAARLVPARDRAEVLGTARAAGGGFVEAASLIAYALRPAGARAVWAQGAVVAAVLAFAAALTPLALIAPFALLALGARDARLAAAATLFWLWRLVTADLAAFGDAPYRWVLMLGGLAVAAYVTRASIRRAAAL
jgi:hypothetical protein